MEECDPPSLLDHLVNPRTNPILCGDRDLEGTVGHQKSRCREGRTGNRL